MTTWAQIPEVLRAHVASLAGCDAEWLAQPGQFIDPVSQCVARLHWLSSKSVGGDSRRFDLVSGTLRETVRGDRSFVVQVMVDSFDQSDANAARTIVERLRTRLSFSSSIATLDAAGLALTEAAGLVDHDTSQDGRVISRSSIDLKFNYADVQIDTSASTGYIETVETPEGTLSK